MLMCCNILVLHYAHLRIAHMVSDSAVFPSQGVKTSLRDKKINLRGLDMIDGTGKEKNIVLHFQSFLYFYHFRPLTSIQLH